MHWQNLRNGFDFDYHTTLDDYVGTVAEFNVHVVVDRALAVVGKYQA